MDNAVNSSDKARAAGQQEQEDAVPEAEAVAKSPGNSRDSNGENPLEMEGHRSDFERGQMQQQMQNENGKIVNINLIKSVILLNTFLYAVCYWIQVGVLPVKIQK